VWTVPSVAFERLYSARRPDTPAELFVLSSSGSDLFGVLKKRHSCRHFEAKPVPGNVLDRLVYAAHRAPTGGNSPHRFVVVVKDPVRLRMLKLASPGYFGDSPAAIIVCTDLRVAEHGLGRLSAKDCAMYDAGAAAENIVLAAYALGLGASFIKSYSEAAVKRILGLPDECRTELIISVGYPAKDEPAPIKKRKGGKLTYRDRYGELWKVEENEDSAISSTHSTTEPGSPEQHVFELALFLVTAARGCVDEPLMYGPLRLLDAASRLAHLYATTSLLRRDEFLIEAKRKIEQNIDKVMVSDDQFIKFMDGIVSEFADETMRRYGSKGT